MLVEKPFMPAGKSGISKTLELTQSGITREVGTLLQFSATGPEHRLKVRLKYYNEFHL